MGTGHTSPRLLAAYAAAIAVSIVVPYQYFAPSSPSSEDALRHQVRSDLTVLADPEGRRLKSTLHVSAEPCDGRIAAARLEWFRTQARLLAREDIVRPDLEVTVTETGRTAMVVVRPDSGAGERPEVDALSLTYHFSDGGWWLSTC